MFKIQDPRSKIFPLSLESHWQLELQVQDRERAPLRRTTGRICTLKRIKASRSHRNKSIQQTPLSKATKCVSFQSVLSSSLHRVRRSNSNMCTYQSQGGRVTPVQMDCKSASCPTSSKVSVRIAFKLVVQQS